MAKVKELNTYSDEYLYYFDTWLTLSDFREGATSVRKAASKYLPQRVAEDDDLYAARLENLVFTPVLSKAITAFVSSLESAPLSLTYPQNTNDLTQYWTSIVNNLDGDGTSLRGWMVKTLSSLLYFGRVYTEVKEDSAFTQFRSLYEKESANLKPKVTTYEPLEVIDTSNNWFKVRQLLTRSSPLEGKRRFIRYTVYEPNSTSVYEAEVRVVSRLGSLYQNAAIPQYSSFRYESITEVLGADGRWHGFSPDTDIPLVSTVNHNLRTPTLIECKLPLELWTGKDVFLKQWQYLKIESSYTESGVYAGVLQRVLTPPPPAPMNDPRSFTEPVDYSDLVTDNNHVIVAANYQIVESKGDALNNLERQLDKIEAQIKTIVNLDYSSSGDSASAKRQSADAKDYDRDLWESSAKTYGVTLLLLAQGVLNIMGRLTGKVVPEVTGLNSFKVNNSEKLLDQTAKLPVDLPKTARRLWYERLISVLLGKVSDQDAEAIKAELMETQAIQENVDPNISDVLAIPGLSGKDVANILRGGLSTLVNNDAQTPSIALDASKTSLGTDTPKP